MMKLLCSIAIIFCCYITIVWGILEEDLQETSHLSLNSHHHQHQHRRHKRLKHKNKLSSKLDAVPSLSLDVLNSPDELKFEKQYVHDEHRNIPSVIPTKDSFTFLELATSKFVHPNATRTLISLRLLCIDARTRYSGCSPGSVDLSCNRKQTKKYYHCNRYKQFKGHLYQAYLCRAATRKASVALHSYKKHSKICHQTEPEKVSWCILKLATQRAKTAKSEQKLCKKAARTAPRTAFVPLTWYKSFAYKYRSKVAHCKSKKTAQCEMELETLRNKFLHHHGRDKQSWTWYQKWSFDMNWRRWNCHRYKKLHQDKKVRQCKKKLQKLTTKYQKLQKRRLKTLNIRLKMSVQTAVKARVSAKLNHEKISKIATKKMLAHHSYLNATGKSFPTLKGKYLYHIRLAESQSHLWRLSHRMYKKYYRLMHSLQKTNVRFHLGKDKNKHYHHKKTTTTQTTTSSLNSNNTASISHAVGSLVHSINPFSK